MKQREFSWLSKAWYAKTSLFQSDYVDEVHFGFHGGDDEKVMICWYVLSSFEKPVPRLEAFDSSWKALLQLQDILAMLSERELLSPEEVCALLVEQGFVDVTPRKRP